MGKEEKIVRTAGIQLQPVEFAHGHGELVGAVDFIWIGDKKLSALQRIIRAADAERIIPLRDKGQFQ